nr:MAG: putative RNA dependent RNA polymerase [Xinjiang mito-like virus 40]
MNKNLYNIVLRLCRIVYPNINVQRFIGPYFKFLCSIIRFNGLIYAVKYFKMCRLYCTRYICNQPLKEPNEFMIGIGKDGWPKRLAFLKDLVHGSKEERKFLFSLLLLTRTLKPLGKARDKLIPSFSSITDLPKTKGKIIPSGFINKFVRDFNLYSEKPSFTDDNIYLSLKAGPHGKATRSAMHSLGLYKPELLQNLYNLTDENGKNYLEKQFNIAIKRDMKPCVHSTILSNCLGKLSLIYDPECKVRVIAIVDYFTQLYLKPVHEKLFSIVKRLPCDRTFTQNPYHNWYNNSHKFWSLDLSSATDRFPIQLQRRLLERIFSDPKLAQSWCDILSQRDFAVPCGPGVYEHSVRYAVGQPMGSYSSWIAFTLSHHLLVHWCAHLCGHSNFNQYIILGDDIVIKNDEVAQMYIKWCGYLNVSISLNKTHVSVDTYEFAKRWFQRGDELTGIPFRGIVDCIINPFQVYTILYDYFKIKNNLYSSSLTLLDLVITFYSGLRILVYDKKNKTKFRFIPISQKRRLELRTFSALLDYTFGYANYENIRNIFCSYVRNDNYVIPYPKVVRSEINRILGDGLAQITLNNAYATTSWLKTLKSNLYEGDETDLGTDPLFISVLSSLKRLIEGIDKFDFTQIDLLLSNKAFSGLNVESIFSNKRNKILEVIEIGKSFRKGFDDLNIFFGNHIIGAHRTASRDAIKMFPWMLNQQYSAFMQVTGETVTPPAPKNIWLG